MFNAIATAKFATTFAVKSVASAAITQIITTTTEKTEDEFIVVATSTVGGHMIGEKLSDKTDSAVDHVAARISAFRNRKNQDTTEQ